MPPIQLTAATESPDALAQEFVRFAVEAGVLRFGEFKTKAGRMSPYFLSCRFCGSSLRAARPRSSRSSRSRRPARASTSFGTDVLRAGVVVASELPRTRATLLVRLMAAGPLLADATAELRALPARAPERAVAEQILLQFQRFLEAQPDQTRTEREFIKTMLKTWEDARAEGRAEGHAAGRAKGRAEGSTQTRAHDLLTVLQVRGIHVSAAAKKRILDQQNLKQLERWLKKAIVATSLDQVLGRRA